MTRATCLRKRKASLICAICSAGILVSLVIPILENIATKGAPQSRFLSSRGIVKAHVYGEPALLFIGLKL